MSILAECPICRRAQSNKNRKCKECGDDLVKAKKSARVRYYVLYRLPNGKQKRESAGFSLTDARDLEGKRKSEKREGKLFDALPGSKWTVEDLKDWYLGLGSVKRLKSFSRVKQCLNNFNDVFSSTQVHKLSLEGLKRYQKKRQTAGRAAATIDMEMLYAKTAVTAAYDNDQIDARALKPFRKVKKKLLKGSNARDRILSYEEYHHLFECSPDYLKQVLVLAINTGMRAGEIRQLQFKHIDRKKRMIHLPASMTKEKKDKDIPINHRVDQMLTNIIRRIDNDHVITCQGKEISKAWALTKPFAAACKAAGIPYGRKTENGIIPHDIRRTVKTNMVEAGVNGIHRDLILGHSLPGMDAHYVKPTAVSLKVAMDKYTYWMDNEWNQESEFVDQTVDQKQKSS